MSTEHKIPIHSNRDLQLEKTRLQQKLKEKEVNVTQSPMVNSTLKLISGNDPERINDIREIASIIAPIAFSFFKSQRNNVQRKPLLRNKKLRRILMIGALVALPIIIKKMNEWAEE